MRCSRTKAGTCTAKATRTGGARRARCSTRPARPTARTQELAFARRHFFLPHRVRDPFHTSAVSTESFVTYDHYDLLVEETRDALGNRVTAGERNARPGPSRRCGARTTTACCSRRW